MKKHTILIFTLLISALSFAQVGIGTTMPNPSAILDLSTTNKGFLAPRVQLTSTSDVSTIATPATGLMVYNLASAGSGASAVFSGFYFFDGVKWQRIISQQPDAVVEFNTSNPNSGAPTFNPNSPASTDYVYVSSVDGRQWTWNGTSYISYTSPSTTPWYLGSGTNDAGANKTSTIYRPGATGIGSTIAIDNSAQLDVNSTSKGFLPPRMTKAQRDAISSPATGLLVFCTNCSSSGGGCLVQNIGTPALPSWECVGSSSSSSVVAACNGFVTGSYISGVAVSGTYTVTVTNNSFSSATLNFSSNDLVLSGVSGLSVSAVSPSTVTLAAGGSQVVTYTVGGTPTGMGTLTGTWTVLSLSCSKTKNVTAGDATFPSNVTTFVFSVNDVTVTPNVVVQGTLAIGTTVQMPYTNGYGTYIAYTSPFVSIPSQFCEDGANDWTFGYSYSAGTFSSSGNITVTLITKKAGVITAWDAKRVTSVQTINFECVTAPWSLNGNTYSNTVGIDEGGDVLRGALAQGGCTSCSAYDAASVNAWVNVTAAEYAKLALISNATKSALTDAVFSQASTNFIGGNYTVTQEVGQAKIPASSYVFAMQFKTHSVILNGNTLDGLKLKVSTTITGAYTTVGNTYASTTAVTASTNYYFVLKRSTYQTPASTQFSAIYTNTARIGTINGGNSTHYGLGDVANTTNSLVFTPYFQVISTTSKLW